MLCSVIFHKKMTLGTIATSARNSGTDQAAGGSQVSSKPHLPAWQFLLPQLHSLPRRADKPPNASAISTSSASLCASENVFTSSLQGYQLKVS
jgi:hypothetical protein